MAGDFQVPNRYKKRANQDCRFTALADNRPRRFVVLQNRINAVEHLISHMAYRTIMMVSPISVPLAELRPDPTMETMP